MILPPPCPPPHSVFSVSSSAVCGFDKSPRKDYPRRVNAIDSPSPGANDVLVWLLETETAERFLGQFRRLLSPDELERAHHYFRESSARRFIANRGFLRLLLGRALGVPPANLVFAEEANGKPVLAGRPALAFNLSHTDRLAAFALSSGRRVGIDIESMRQPADLEGIAKYVFPAGVAARLAGMPGEARWDGFFRMWTRLEAAAKACGLGLGGMPGLKTVALDGEPPLTLDLDGNRWRIIDLDLDSVLPGARDHRAALCLEGAGCDVRLFEADDAVLRAWISL
jgi:4'-phosphopantetheinyl transferase